MSQRPNWGKKKIGHYTLDKMVGSGGLGEVYKVTDERNGKIYALKRLHDRYQHDQRLLGLFHKEVMIHSRVNHKHCLRLIESDLTPPDAHIVMDFIEGMNCHKLLRTSGGLPPLVACAVVVDILKGLDHLHCMDIIHSDITLANIIIENTGRVVVADFGLSCLPEVENYEGMTVGTPGYQPPERLMNAATTPQTDIYGVGIILHEMLRGERLFGSQLSQKEIKQKMKKIDLSWINTGHPKLDGGLKQTLGKALEPRPAKRFQSPEEFMHALYYECLKPFGVRYMSPAILQWMVDSELSDHPAPENQQNIYVDLESA